MQLKLAKRFPCEVEVFSGDKLTERYILGYRAKEQYRAYVLDKLGEEKINKQDGGGTK